MARAAHVHVVGLREFQRELRKIDPMLPRQLRLAALAAAEPVAERARARHRALGGVNAKASRNIKAVGEQRGAGIKLGATRSSRRGSPPIPPFGVEFGGGLYGKGHLSPRGGHTTQFKPHRGKQGWGIYPEIRAQRKEIIDTFGDHITALARRAFPN